MPELSDPTLQTKGRLSVGLNLDNNASYISSGAVNGLKVTPEAFTGDWMIGLLSPACFNIVWLSVEYAPPKDYGGGLPEARLCFKVSGCRRPMHLRIRRMSISAAPVRWGRTCRSDFSICIRAASRTSCSANPPFPSARLPVQSVAARRAGTW
ncbi:hypothetical protein [Bradyrhizobium diazoefficiens]|uniref:hypothetical protein n=1 Tax=Bradyrhizobium diazoefficiens TaxID=1355477 RepID=UPI00272D8870|nr:hypothetical protein [Bradyrhizobium diazoefficiens]WLA68970.1 hypothetical protein QNN01_21380 [Bradyrhizobium diazoefficiens]